MKKIKIILPFSIIVFIIFFNFLNLYKSKLDIANEIRGTIVSKNGNSFILKSREKILFYSKNNYQVGDIVIINGEMTKPIKNTNFNLFNYQNYLKSKKIYWIMYSENDYKIGENKFYKINKNNCNPYIKALIFGDTSSIEDDIKDSYQKNGISHLFAISGMHITLMTSIIYFIIKKIINNKFIDNIIISLFLFFYMFITCFSISVIRASIMFIILNFTKLKSNYVILIVFLLFILYNPYLIYNIGFLFSFIISFFIINLKINIKNYFLKILYTSYFSFLASIPILVNSYFEINLTSIISNLFFIPLITFIIYPFSIIVFFIPNLSNIFNYLTNILEWLSILFNRINVFFIIPHMNIFIVLAYYILLYVFIIKDKKKSVFLLMFIFLYSYIYPYKVNPIIDFINVGQGDSILISYKNTNILIDTGGNYNNTVGSNVLLPYIKSRGIKKIDYLIITHGDIDHIGASFSLADDIKIDNLILNNYNNESEEQLINKLNVPSENYSKNILVINGLKFYFLNKKNLDENKGSLVIYTTINNKNILLLADVTKKEEIEIINEYKLDNLDILKVAHHGSKTSTSSELLNLNLKNIVISVGKNNFGHPSKETVNDLSNKNAKLYMTSINGTIRFVLKDEIKVYTCH